MEAFEKATSPFITDSSPTDLLVSHVHSLSTNNDRAVEFFLTRVSLMPVVRPIQY